MEDYRHHVSVEVRRRSGSQRGSVHTIAPCDLLEHALTSAESKAHRRRLRHCARMVCGGGVGGVGGGRRGRREGVDAWGDL